jgi:hypothetical protein
MLATPDGLERRYVGAQGAFFEWDNGFSAGIPNSPIVSEQRGPYAREPEAHRARVLAYFAKSGLPQDQIFGVSFTTKMQAQGRVDDPVVRPEFVKYTHTVHRGLAGGTVPVPESFAWASFNADDNVTFEEVWWPDLPSSVTVDVATMQATVAPGQDATFRSRLPTEMAQKPGRVTVHHSMPSADHWYAQVTWDVDHDSQTRSFDIRGSEVDFGPPHPPNGDFTGRGSLR